MSACYIIICFPMGCWFELPILHTVYCHTLCNYFTALLVKALVSAWRDQVGAKVGTSWQFLAIVVWLIWADRVTNETFFIACQLICCCDCCVCHRLLGKNVCCNLPNEVFYSTFDTEVSVTVVIQIAMEGCDLDFLGDLPQCQTILESR